MIQQKSNLDMSPPCKDLKKILHTFDWKNLTRSAPTSFQTGTPKEGTESQKIFSVQVWILLAKSFESKPKHNLKCQSVKISKSSKSLANCEDLSFWNFWFPFFFGIFTRSERPKAGQVVGGKKSATAWQASRHLTCRWLCWYDHDTVVSIPTHVERTHIT